MVEVEPICDTALTEYVLTGQLQRALHCALHHHHYEMKDLDKSSCQLD